MNSSYKIALVSAIALCAFVLVYFVSRGHTPSAPQLTSDTSVEMPTIDHHADAATPAPAPPAPVEPVVTDIPAPDPSAIVPPPARSAGGQVVTPSSMTPTTPAPVSPAPAAIAPPPVDAHAAIDRGPTTAPADTARNPIDRIPAFDMGPGAQGPGEQGPSWVTFGPPAAGTIPLEYTIQPGDTLSSIAQKIFHSSAKWVDIAKANPNLDPKRLQVNQKIRLPRDVSAATPSPRPGATMTPPATMPATPSAANPGGTYTVMPGDTLSSIAKQAYHDPNLWDLIYNANRSAIGNSADDVEVGMKLVIPPKPAH